MRREQREQRRENDDRRDRQRERSAVELERLHGDPGQHDVEEQHGDREQRQPPLPAGDEEERERDRDADRRGHPRAEQDDQPADLAACVPRVGRPERRADNRLADKREDAGSGRHGGEGDERRADDVARRALVRQRSPAQRHARDQPERRRGHRNERRGDEVGVREARDRAGAEAAREAEADDEERLQHDRQRRSPRQLDETPTDVERPSPPPLGADRQRRQGDSERDGAVHERPPGADDDPVLVDPPEDHGQAERAAERIARGGRRVAVVRGQRARAERREQLRHGGGNEEDERVRRCLLRASREPAHELGGRPVVGEHADRERGDGDRGEREGVRPEDARERAVLAGAREGRHDGDANRARRKHEDEEDGIGREEAVGHDGAAELARDDDADGGRECGDDGQRERRQQTAREGAPGTRALGFATRASVFRMSTDPIWTENDLADLRREFGDAYAGRTVLVTGADGFMGSHLTDALVEIGADVHAFVRATSSGALNNISHLRNRLKVKFADLTDKTSIDYLVKELRDTVSDKPYVFHLGAQAHVGESWHRPYETVMANTIGTLNLLQSIVDYGLELEKFDTAGTSEEYGNVRETVAHHHDFDDAGGLILHERSPINPKSIYATAKVAADFLTMNYHDAFGVPGVVTRMFNNYGPRQNPRYVTGTIITQALARPEIELGALEPLRDFCFCTDGVRGHLTVAAQGVPGDVYVYGQGSNISMADWADLILRTGVEHGFWPDDRQIVIDEGRLRPGVTDVMALRVGYEKLNRETGWEPKVSWEEGVLRTIPWYAEHRERWIGRVDWLGRGRRPRPR